MAGRMGRGSIRLPHRSSLTGPPAPLGWVMSIMDSHSPSSKSGSHTRSAMTMRSSSPTLPRGAAALASSARRQSSATASLHAAQEMYGTSLWKGRAARVKRSISICAAPRGSARPSAATSSGSNPSGRRFRVVAVVAMAAMPV